MIDLSVVIVSWNTRDLLRGCLETLACELAGLGCEVFVVDNNSTDGSAELVAKDFRWVKLITNETNIGFARANNQALAGCRGRYILFLNPDTQVRPGAIQVLMNFLEARPGAAVVAPRLLNSDLSVQRSCRRFPSFGSLVYELVGLSRLFPQIPAFGRYKMLEWGHDSEREVDQPEGACLMVRRPVLSQVGAFDEGFFMLFEEVDWCFRVKQAGWQIWFTPAAEVVHHYGQSIKQVKVKMILSSHRGLYRYWQKHHRGSWWLLDPFAYLGLMCLALLRISAYQIRRALGAQGAGI